MSHATALMYHALYDGPEEWESLNAEERPYAVSVSDFNRQLDAMENANISILDPDKIFNEKSLGDVNYGVLLTFDDGHTSFYRHAYRILKERGYRAIFFITTDLIKSRADFCSWDNLEKMAQDGFMIQAHGKTHQFLPDLDADSLADEFHEPKKILEQHTGQKVVCMSFPGGRFKKREVEVGRRLGYEVFFTSRIGVIRNSAIRKNHLFDRVPIRHGMKMDTFLQLAQGRVLALWPRKFIYQFKLLLKSLLGNRFYHVLYQKLFD